jgi:hypothetical protein
MRVEHIKAVRCYYLHLFVASPVKKFGSKLWPSVLSAHAGMYLFQPVPLALVLLLFAAPLAPL